MLRQCNSLAAWREHKKGLFLSMNREIYLKTVTLKDLWGIFIQRLWIIALAACVCGAGLFAVNRITFVPQYASTATLYILRQADSATASDTSSDFSLALKVVNDCTYLLKSHTVLDEVIDSLNLDMEYEDLYDCVSTSNPEETRILEVTVKADSPEIAKRIVDQICTIGSERIEDAMGFQQVNLYELGTTDPDPCNKTRFLTFIFSGVIAAVMAYAIFLIAFLLDDRIKTDEDVERYLGLSVLGNIPSADSKKLGKYGYYKAYAAYRAPSKREGGDK